MFRIFQLKEEVINNYNRLEIFAHINSKKRSSSIENGSGVWESISICPMFSPFKKIGTTISALTAILQAI